MTPEQIKQQLDMLGRRLSALEDGHNSGKSMNYDKARTALDRLMSTYRRMIVLAAANGVVATVLLSRLLLLPAYASIVLVVFFMVAAIMDAYLLRGLRGIDIKRMGVAQVACKALHYRRRHHQFQLVLIPMAGLLLMVLFHVFAGQQDSAVIIYGMIAGAVVGGLCGVRIYRRMMRDYRTLAVGE